MSEYNVKLSYGNNISVNIETPPKLKLQTNIFTIVAESLEDLENVDTSTLDKVGNTTNNYVMVYDSVLKKYKFVNPDMVISAAVADGLPQSVIDELDVELDNKIDLDGGSF